jgi:hypothetical protein
MRMTPPFADNKTVATGYGLFSDYLIFSNLFLIKVKSAVKQCYETRVRLMRKFGMVKQAGW